jgi:predicted AAA+ superfamily ATPase
MIERIIKKKILLLARKFPVISVTGPRQSGKTTLIKSAFPDYRYETLEDPVTRLLAQNDPVRFLGGKEKIIIDEIQRSPELFSYIQGMVDKNNISGQFIISGSQSFLLNQHISQSLAGRVAILNLLPLSIAELQKGKIDVTDYEKLIFTGFFPRIYDKKISPADFYPNFIQTYIERDIRLLQNIHDLNTFVRFIKICAGRTGQLINYTSLANDCGISPNSARSWLSLLESSHIVFLLQPHYQNFKKRLVKMARLYFTDTGLASSLLDIQSENQLSSHYLRGALFENLILSEFIKMRLNSGLRPNIYFWRDNKGMEIDCLIETGETVTPVEIKSGNTFNPDYFKNLRYWNRISGNNPENSWVIYGGDYSRATADGNLISWKNISKIPLVM